VLREAGLIRVRTELGLELLDAGTSEAFCVADHQLAHVYVRRRERVAEVKRLLEAVPGVATVLDDEGSGSTGSITRARASWWRWPPATAGSPTTTARRCGRAGLRPHRRHPPQARLRSGRVVPGSGAARPQAQGGWTLLKKTAGFRYLMDVIPLDASLVRGSHGRLPESRRAGPVLITSEPGLVPDEAVLATDVKTLLLAHVFGPSP